MNPSVRVGMQIENPQIGLELSKIPRPKEATAEMVNVAEIVVNALVDLSFFHGAGGDKGPGVRELKVREIL